MLQKTRPSQLCIRASSAAYSSSLTFAATLHSQLLEKDPVQCSDNCPLLSPNQQESRVESTKGASDDSH